MACPRCGREVPEARPLRYRIAGLRHYGWQLYDVARIVPWCGHATEFVALPERGGWCRLVPVVGDVA